MTDRNWDAELAKIDKQLSSISDEKLIAEQRAAAAPVAPGVPVGSRPAAATMPAGAVKGIPIVNVRGERVWAAWLKVLIAVAAAVSLMFWPWPARCGAPLVGFTAATAAVTLLGVWSALGTWRHRLGLAHAASLLVIVWGLVLGARETLPRVGYAIPTIDRPAGWTCDAVPALPPPQTGAPAGSPAASVTPPTNRAP
jgi:hypothetical protein